MAYEMKAEYEFPAVSAWHIVPAGESRSLCGAPLAPTAPTRPLAELKITNVACRPCEVLHFSLRARAPMRRAAVQEAADRGLSREGRPGPGPGRGAVVVVIAGIWPRVADL